MARRKRVTEEQCFYCGNRLGIVPVDYQPDPILKYLDHVPCQSCAEHMKQGVILISVKDGEVGEVPWRTGGWAVVSGTEVKRLIEPESVASEILRKRVCFVPDTVWDKLGLPRGGSE